MRWFLTNAAIAICKVILIVAIASSVFWVLMAKVAFGQEPVAPGQSYKLDYYWVNHEGRDIQVYGYLKDGAIVWNPKEGRNARPRERRSQPQGEPERLPTAEITGRPEPIQAPAPAWETNGVMRPKETAPVERYSAKGEEAKRFVTEAVGDSKGKMHLTIIGNADERARVTNDIKTDPAFNDLRDRLLVQDYDPKEWAVDPALGFRPGKPAIIVQAARGPSDTKGGRVIYRTQDYAVGAKGLAEAVRKADPDYDPERDPGPHKPAPQPQPEPSPAPPILPKMPDLSSIDPLIFVAVALIGLVLFLPKKA